MLECQFVAECKPNDDDYNESERFIAGGARKAVLKALTKKAVELAPTQPVICMLSRGECTEIAKSLNNVCNFTYDDTTFEAVLE